nr:hypothetical protein [uncultured Albidiferax sp.]
MPPLLAPGLLLRPFEPSNAPASTEAVRESLPLLLQWMPWAHAGYSAQDVLAWFAFTHAGQVVASGCARVLAEFAFLGRCSCTGWR